jgi:hypothetical protein
MKKSRQSFAGFFASVVSISKSEDFLSRASFCGN